MKHLAFVHAPVLAEILAGRKTCESRLSLRPHPARRVQPGDEILFKQTGGDVLARATVARVEHYDGLTPADIACLREMYNSAVCGCLDLDAYWQSKQSARFASFIWLTDVTPAYIPQSQLPSSRMAWIADFSPTSAQ